MIKNFCDAVCQGDCKHGLPPFDGQMEELADSVQKVAEELKKSRISLQEAEIRLSALGRQETAPKTVLTDDEAGRRSEDPQTGNRHGE